MRVILNSLKISIFCTSLIIPIIASKRNILFTQRNDDINCQKKTFLFLSNRIIILFEYTIKVEYV